MTTTYDWPASLRPDQLEMRVIHNTKVFTSPFSSTAQVLNYTGDRWGMVISLPLGNDDIKGAAIEALLDRMNGPANRLRAWNFKRPVPQGTLRDGITVSVVNGSLAAVSVVNGALAAVTVISGTAVLAAALAAGAGTGTLQTVVGRTLLAGDHIGLPNGQNVRLMADAVADGAGLMAIEFQPRARSAMSAYGAIVWNKPKVELMLKTDGAPVPWRPGMYESTSLDLIEAL